MTLNIIVIFSVSLQNYEIYTPLSYDISITIKFLYGETVLRLKDYIMYNIFEEYVKHTSVKYPRILPMYVMIMCLQLEQLR